MFSKRVPDQMLKPEAHYPAPGTAMGFPQLKETLTDNLLIYFYGHVKNLI